ncbi:MAG: tRNA dimethylallyltransferase [Planctomycetaceae bacterium]|nr:MAG: tRNA dimethylallyltransferase [Planctomycetaceae bacterium]
MFQFEPALLRACWILVGPTACGKTAVALELAAHLPAEIVALDSMTLYRGMDIGTAKPSIIERQRVPHHLFDVLEPHEEYNVAQYVAAARACCREILQRGRIPLLVGGTGMYLRALLRGLNTVPPADPELRRALEHKAHEQGAEIVHRELATIDPIAAQKLPPSDLRRVIRALEVYYLTGQRWSMLPLQGPRPPHERPVYAFWLDPPRPWLHARIDARVVSMFKQGWLQEVLRLRARGPLSKTARQAVGYAEILGWLAAHEGHQPMVLGTGPEVPIPADLIARIQARTRQFAKRQWTWFRHLEELHRVPLTGDETPQQVAALLLSRAAKQPAVEVTTRSDDSLPTTM